MKKIFCIFLLIYLSISLCACGQSATSRNISEPEVEEDESIILDNASPIDSDDTPDTVPDSKSAKNNLSKPDIDGFDEATNSICSIGSVKFSVPSYYGNPASNSTEDTLYYYAETGESVAMLSFELSKDADVTEIQENFDVFKESLTSKILGNFDGKEKESRDIILSGMPASIVRFDGTVAEFSITGAFCFLLDEKSNEVIFTVFAQTENTRYNYLNDYAKIISSCVYDESAGNHVSSSADTATSDFKSIMDSYEAFFDEYIAFMEKYSNATDAMTMLSMFSDYSNYMARYVEVTEKLNEIDSDQLSPSDLAYYLEVMNRINQKILAVSESVHTESAEETDSIRSNTEKSIVSNVVTPEFKTTMDSYEAFFDEYIAFMEKYSNTTDTMKMLSMLSDYSNYMARYIETVEKLNEIDSDQLSTADLAYYLEVTNRINQKLATISDQ